MDDFETIFNALPPTSSRAEITVEANPGTADLTLLRGLRALGVNRLSLGVQTSDDSLLKRLGRLHSFADALDAFAAARRAGFDNISLDLIFGLPGQTMGSWLENLERIVPLGAEHLSLYGLTIEDGTPFGRLLRGGMLNLPDDDCQADMFLLALDVLGRAGYRRYEISNWAARRGSSFCYAKHNLVYWRNQPYVGLGAAAHSYFRGRRLANTPDVRQYTQAILDGRCAAVSDEEIGPDLEMAETMMLGLRLSEGIHEQAFADRFGVGVRERYGRILDELVSQGLLVAGAGRFALSERGVLLGNEVFSRFLSPVL